MTSQAREQIKLEAISLRDGESKAIECPFCNAQHEKKCYITKMGSTIKYYCHRVSCTGRGVIGDGNYHHAHTKKQFNPKIHERPTCEVDDRLSQFVERRYGITKEDLDANGVLMESTGSALVFPIRSGGIRIGKCTKDFRATRGSGRQKSITYREKEGEVLFWTRNSERRSGKVYLSEGCLDAMKIAKCGVRSCALLGTNLGEAEALAIAKVANEVVWCLDNDAVAVAHKLAKKYALLFKSKVIIFSEDPKDTNLEKLKEKICYSP